MFVCATGEKFDFANSIGVGLIDTAILLSRVVYEMKPDKIIFIGSAGSYDYSIAMHSVFISCVSTQIESSFLLNSSYTPISNEIRNVSHETFLINQSDDIFKVVNSSNYITTSELVAKSMTKNGIVLENMEFFSVLKVAEYFKLPAFGIFCVTNHCNANAHDDFLRNRDIATNILRDFVFDNKL